MRTTSPRRVPEQRTLLIGMGNPFLSDDAVGVRLATELERRLGPRPGLDVVMECSVGGLALLDVVAGYDALIAMDAVRTRDGIPGAWWYLSGVQLQHTRHLTSIHDVNFATALELGRRLGMKIPNDDRVHVFAVEVRETSLFSASMTEPLEAAFPSLSDAIFEKVSRILHDGCHETSLEAISSP